MKTLFSIQIDCTLYKAVYKKWEPLFQENIRKYGSIMVYRLALAPE